MEIHDSSAESKVQVYNTELTGVANLSINPDMNVEVLKDSSDKKIFQSSTLNTEPPHDKDTI